jgi:hypothetical protein
MMGMRAVWDLTDGNNLLVHAVGRVNSMSGGTVDY